MGSGWRVGVGVRDLRAGPPDCPSPPELPRGGSIRCRRRRSTVPHTTPTRHLERASKYRGFVRIQVQSSRIWVSNSAVLVSEAASIVLALSTPKSAKRTSSRILGGSYSGGVGVWLRGRVGLPSGSKLTREARQICERVGTLEGQRETPKSNSHNSAWDNAPGESRKGLCFS